MKFVMKQTAEPTEPVVEFNAYVSKTGNFELEANGTPVLCIYPDTRTIHLYTAAWNSGLKIENENEWGFPEVIP